MQLGAGPVLRPAAQPEAFEHQPADELMRVVEGDAGAGQRFGKVGGDQPAFGRRAPGGFRTKLRGFDHRAGHFKRGFHLTGGLEQRLLILLHVAIIGQREAFHRHE